ncbi:antiterminator Q family protein [Utexia brackfieldae]|uniref:antiterminator Q family protein n=1 Tax=Utexia brackfieldae TaxID=3074108 RepID=UPI00370D947F
MDAHNQKKIEFDIGRDRLTTQEINHFIAHRNINYILERWGAYHRAGLDHLGYACITLQYQKLQQHNNSVKQCSEDDAILLEAILLRLERSQDPEKKAMSQIIKDYYIGIENREVANPVPLKNIKMIGKRIGYGATKTAKLKDAAENYVCGYLDAMDKVLDCERW